MARASAEAVSTTLAAITHWEEYTMSRRSIFTLSAIAALGLALLPSIIAAQQRTLKEQLVGTWAFVSCDSTTATGAKVPLCAAPADGILTLDASGWSTSVITPRGRAKFATPDRAAASADQVKAAALNVTANFGTWSVNEGDKTITRHYVGALTPNNDGLDVKYSVSLAGDELKLVTTQAAGGRGETTYRRVR